MRPEGRSVTFLLLVFVALTAAADWERVAPGVDYQRYREGDLDIHVARIDMRREDLRIVSTREADRGLRVSQFARRNHAIVAVNAGYFDQHMNPTGLTVGPCGQWTSTKDTSWGAVVAFGPRRAEIFDEKETMDAPEPWITSAVSGWPTLVSNCRPRDADDLPGSDAFARSPHPRTAIGFSRDGTRVYLVVADGRREGVPGLTLDELASWMREELDVCRALNLDGGGSSALWVKDRIVNRPSGGKERRVADHLAVVHTMDVIACDANGEKEPDPATRPKPSPSLSQSRRHH